MAYRSGSRPQRPRAVVRYRQLPLPLAVLITAALAFGCVIMASQASDVARTVNLDCAERQCVVIRQYGPITTRETIPLDRIKSVGVRSHKHKNTVSYSVVLTTDDDTIKLCRPTAKPAAEALQARVSAMVDAKSTPPTQIAVEEGSPIAALLMLTFSLLLTTIAFVVFRAATLEFDLDRAVVHLTRSRFPLRPVRQTFRAADLERARVNERPGSKGGQVYSVALVLRAGGEVELLPGASGMRKHPDETAARINELLARMHEENPP